MNRATSQKTIAELEEERMQRFVNTPAQDRQAAGFKKPAPAPAAQAQASGSPRSWNTKGSGGHEFQGYGPTPVAGPDRSKVGRMDHHAKPMTQSSTEFQGLFGSSAPAPKEQNTTGRMDHHAKPAQAPGYSTQGATLTGVMDLSTRVEYLNSLLEQGAINEDEYAKRAEPLQVAQEIIQACTSGDARGLEKILNDNPYMNVDLIAEKESNPVSVAVSSIIAGRGNSNLLKTLLAHGGQANKRSNGMTPLLSICKKPQFGDVVNCARVLLDKGADATATTIVTGKTETISCISYAVEGRASPDLIKILLEHGASPNDLLQPHGPLLVNCIIEEYNEIARVLLEFGADPNCRQSGLGASALAIALTNKYVQMVELLLQRGADRDAPIMRDQKTSARQLVAELVKKDPGAYQRIERMF